MKTYYSKKGKVLGGAWGYMTCKRNAAGVEHKPHSHNPEYAMYGPYMCGGFPVKKVYDTPPRKPAN
jgi:hypothetical protein